MVSPKRKDNKRKNQKERRRKEKRRKEPKEEKTKEEKRKIKKEKNRKEKYITLLPHVTVKSVLTYIGICEPMIFILKIRRVPHIRLMRGREIIFLKGQSVLSGFLPYNRIRGEN